jgi:hypothetical protein
MARGAIDKSSITILECKWGNGGDPVRTIGVEREKQSAGKLKAVVRTEICSEKSVPNCRGVIDPVAFFETESLS